MQKSIQSHILCRTGRCISSQRRSCVRPPRFVPRCRNGRFSEKKVANTLSLSSCAVRSSRTKLSSRHCGSACARPLLSVTLCALLSSMSWILRTKANAIDVKKIHLSPAPESPLFTPSADYPNILPTGICSVKCEGPFPERTSEILEITATARPYYSPFSIFF